MADLGGWTEAILLSLAGVAIVTIILTSMNLDYNKTYDVGITDGTTESLFVTYTNQSQDRIQGGETTLDGGQGITLKDSYNLMKDLMNVLWTFLSGGWIEHLASMMNLGAAGMVMARVFRLLFVISLVFTLIYILFKVKP